MAEDEIAKFKKAVAGAVDKFKKGEFGAALKGLAAIPREKRDAPLAWHFMGLCFFELEKFREAEACFARASVLDAKFSQAWISRGECWNRMGDPARAARFYEKGTALEPENVEALFALSMACSASGDAKKAGEALGKALALDRKKAEGLFLSAFDRALEASSATGEQKQALRFFFESLFALRGKKSP